MDKGLKVAECQTLAQVTSVHIEDAEIVRSDVAVQRLRL